MTEPGERIIDQGVPGGGALWYERQPASFRWVGDSLVSQGFCAVYLQGDGYDNAKPPGHRFNFTEKHSYGEYRLFLIKDGQPAWLIPGTKKVSTPRRLGNGAYEFIHRRVAAMQLEELSWSDVAQYERMMEEKEPFLVTKRVDHGKILFFNDGEGLTAASDMEYTPISIGLIPLGHRKFLEERKISIDEPTPEQKVEYGQQLEAERAKLRARSLGDVAINH